MVTLTQKSQKSMDVVKSGFRLWKDTFGETLSLALLFTLSMVYLCLYFPAVGITMDSHGKLLTDPHLLNIGLASGVGFAYFLITAIITAAMIHRMDRVAQNEDASLEMSFSVACKKALPFALVALLSSGIMAAGYFLLGIPGIILTVYFIFPAYLVIMDNKGVKAAIKDGYKLVKNNGWHIAEVLGYISIALLAVLGVLGILNVLLSYTFFKISFLITDTKAAFNLINTLPPKIEYFTLLFSSITAIILYPLSNACVMAALYDLKARKKARNHH